MRQIQARERIPALSVAIHRADRPLWTFEVGTSGRDDAPLGPQTPVSDGLDHEDIHRRTHRSNAATTGCSISMTTSPSICRCRRTANSPSGACCSHTIRLAARAVRRRLGCAADARRWRRCWPSLTRAERVLPTARRYHYSNLGMSMLGHLVARLRGGTWAELLVDRILRPLGLTDITLEPGENGAVGYLVDAYSDHSPARAATDLAAAWRRPVSSGRPRRIWPAGPRSWPIRPQWIPMAGC